MAPSLSMPVPDGIVFSAGTPTTAFVDKTGKHGLAHGDCRRIDSQERRARRGENARHDLRLDSAPRRPVPVSRRAFRALPGEPDSAPA